MSRDTIQEVRQRPILTGQSPEAKRREARQERERLRAERLKTRPLRRAIVAILRELPQREAWSFLQAVAADKGRGLPSQTRSIVDAAGQLLAWGFTEAELEGLIRRLGSEPPPPAALPAAAKQKVKRRKKKDRPPWMVSRTSRPKR
jgi:hypothetical protein